MSCKESFNTNTDAITHDSDPRLLRFVGISQDPTNMNGEGVQTIDFGTSVNLENAVTPGSGFTPGVVGPTVSELTGGAGTLITFELTSPPRDMEISDLVGGETTVRIEFSDASAVTAAITAADITSDINDITSLFTPAWSSQTGKQIVSVQTHVGTPWSAIVGGTITSFFFNLSISVGGDFAAIDCVPGVDATIPIGGTLIPDYTQPIQAIVPSVVGLVGTVVQNATLYIPIDANSIHTNGTPTIIDPYGQDCFVNWSHVYFASFEGWTIISETITVSDDYGVSAHGPLAPSSIINTLLVVGGAGHDFGHIQPLITPVATPPSMGLYTVDSTTHLELFIRTDPATTPAVDTPILMTEAYEIRQRNRAAFKVILDPPTPIDDVPRTVVLTAFASQGASADFQRQWTPLPMDIILGNGSFSVDSSPITVPVPSDITNMPTAYSGTLIIISKDYTGPWNYIRFLITPTPETEYDLSGYTMLIVANAREL